MSRQRTKAEKRMRRQMREAAARSQARAAGVAENVARLLDVVGSIPGAKIVTLSDLRGSGDVIVAGPDGSLGRDPGEGSLFLAKLARGMDAGAVLAIRAFDEAHPEPVAGPDGRAVDDQRQMLYGAALGGGDWRPLSSDDLRGVFTTCPCCGKRLPGDPRLDYFDLRPIAGGDPGSQET